MALPPFGAWPTGRRAGIPPVVRWRSAAVMSQLRLLSSRRRAEGIFGSIVRPGRRRVPRSACDHDVPGSGQGCRRIPLCPAWGAAAGCMMAIRMEMAKLWIMTSAVWRMVARSSPTPRTPSGGR